jgi:CheY-like chemotaxis protein
MARDLSGSATVLLVEDEDSVRMGGVRALKSRGYTVHEASSGVEALEIYDALRARSTLSCPTSSCPKWMDRRCSAKFTSAIPT